jgi:hypothetical protein
MDDVKTITREVEPTRVSFARGTTVSGHGEKDDHLSLCGETQMPFVLEALMTVQYERSTADDSLVTRLEG